MTRNSCFLAVLLCGFATAARADDWAYRAWLAKAGRVLRAGQPLPEGQLEDLAQKTPDEALDALLGAADFADTVLDFDLYFLGKKPQVLYRPDYSDPTQRSYAMEVLQTPQAIASAQAAATGGDFLKVLEDNPHRYLTPFTSAAGDQPLVDFHTALDQAVAAFYPQGADKPADKDAGCALIGSEDSPTGKAQDALFDSNLFNGGSNFALEFSVAQFPAIDVNISCFLGGTTVEAITGKIAAWRASVDKLVAAADAYDPKAYKIRAIGDLRTMAGAEADSYLHGSAFDAIGFWYVLPNSSTNYNRKRAAHMLKTYFCDDLTPLNVVPGPNSPHAGDAHASDPSCQSCHYKLDPMAGFFKDRGILGYDFHAVPAQFFDDNALFTGDRLSAYRAAWPVTGYIRSTLNPQQNDYGTSLSDLMAIIRRAPEVKQCLTRRLVEYTLGREQTVDGAWLDHLSQEFTAASTTGDSTTALKSVLKELLLSKTFAQDDPQADQCYDHYPDDSVSELPCAVSFVIRNNCAGCHRGTDQRHGGLDLTHWTDEAGFPHLDAAGNQRAKGDSLARVQARLNTADPKLSMPLMRDMPATDKARLYGWVSDQITQGGTP